MPHVVRSVIDQGQQYNVHPQVISSPVSAETARTLTEMLAIALEEEASVALVEGYRLAGKTGTGEIPTELGYTSSLTNASFVGWGPADDPKFLVYVCSKSRPFRNGVLRLQRPFSAMWSKSLSF